ncbi:hypothetical protein J6TS1_45360 [Siminovitchia terrae]|uniref:Uncharacterized protein n=1 Tax=Siminovitchia terrae TaxID=1914933 RepID=A0ABQ4L439_SIMTE|nr:hypothetical protein [Siminovitchia terrae]GIN98666.1 hypothetical protein J6TS1_45360 [Siminovitchia terrae]
MGTRSVSLYETASASGSDMEERFNFIQQKSPTSVSGEMNAYGIPFSEGSNPG